MDCGSSWSEEIDLPGIPPMMGALGAFGGIRVVETPALKYDEMMVMANNQAIAVGELAHFKYRIHQLNLNEQLRRRCREHIETSASQILGEPWKVGGGV
jgi:hypothetical protein